MQATVMKRVRAAPERRPQTTTMENEKKKLIADERKNGRMDGNGNSDGKSHRIKAFRSLHFPIFAFMHSTLLLSHRFFFAHTFRALCAIVAVALERTCCRTPKQYKIMGLIELIRIIDLFDSTERNRAVFDPIHFGCTCNLISKRLNVRRSEIVNGSVIRGQR